MPTTNTHAPGSFCWIELATTDAPAAAEFYTQLFGWDLKEVPMGEHGTYYVFQKGGRDAAAAYTQQQEGAPPNWMSYVAVEDADAAAEKAKDLGAQLYAPPFDVFDLGRMAVLGDPQGAAFAVWQAKDQTGVGVRDEPDTLCWNELQARDVEAAKKFYAALFGWRMKESEEYTEWHLGSHAIGGMLPSQAPPEVPSHWMPYFSVEDCDGAVAKATSLGASTFVPAMDIAGVGRFSVLADPQGAVFALIRLSM